MADTEGTKIDFLGGNNDTRIGGNSFIVEHSEKRHGCNRIMVDLGALFPPEWTDLDAVIPDVREYLDFQDKHAEKPLNAMFISHCHEDHIGGLVHLARAGYKFPVIYTSSYTKELLNTAFKEARVPEEYLPEVTAVAAGETVEVGDNMEITPFNVSHSTVGAMGFHILTTVKGRVCAGIVDPGDYRLGSTQIGPGFNEEDFVRFIKDKPVTHVLLDSTSSDSSDKYLVDFATAVNNTKEQIAKHNDKQVISAVISRSIQNLAIDLEAAKQTEREVYIDGYWAKLAFMAMQRSGVHDYDEVVFNSNDLKNAKAQEYLAKYPHEKRYIIPSGAFAESKKGKKSGLYKMSEQQKVSVGKNGKIKGKGESGHPDFTVDNETLILARQRCIEDINGKQVRAMYNRLASLGATIVENEAANNTGRFATSLMQRTGHAVRSETKHFIELIVNNRRNQSRLAFIPIHGDVQQLAQTAKVVREAGGEPSICYNSDVIKVWSGGTKKLEDKPKDKQYWIAVREEDISGRGNLSSYQYSLIDKNFNVVEDLCHVENMGNQKAPERDYTSNNVERILQYADDFRTMSRRESKIMREKISRKQKKKEKIKAARNAAGYSKHSLPKNGGYER